MQRLGRGRCTGFRYRIHSSKCLSLIFPCLIFIKGLWYNLHQSQCPQKPEHRYQFLQYESHKCFHGKDEFDPHRLLCQTRVDHTQSHWWWAGFDPRDTSGIRLRVGSDSLDSWAGCLRRPGCFSGRPLHYHQSENKLALWRCDRRRGECTERDQKSNSETGMDCCRVFQCFNRYVITTIGELPHHSPLDWIEGSFFPRKSSFFEPVKYVFLFWHENMIVLMGILQLIRRLKLFLACFNNEKKNVHLC